jgi:hypothetical protein
VTSTTFNSQETSCFMLLSFIKTEWKKNYQNVSSDSVTKSDIFRICIWTYNVIIPKEMKSTSLNSLHTNIGHTRLYNTFSSIPSPHTYHSQRHTCRKHIQHATILYLLLFNYVWSVRRHSSVICDLSVLCTYWIGI